MNKNEMVMRKKAVTPIGRVSYPSLFEPKSFEGQEPKYSMSLLFEKKDRDKLKPLAEACQAAAIEKWGEDKDRWPKKLKMPFRDGDTDRPDSPEYESTVFIGMSSKKAPGVVDQKRKTIRDPESIYAGCYARAEVIAFAYDVSGNRGVSFALQNVQKASEGERIGGRRDAASVFDELDVSDENLVSFGDAEVGGSAAGNDFGF